MEEEPRQTPPPPSGWAGHTATPPAAARGLLPLSPAGYALLLLNLLLGVFAYREILGFTPETALEHEVEGWFFVPTDTAPPLVVMLASWLLYRRRERLLALPRTSGPALITGLTLLAALAVVGWATATGAADLLAFSLIFLLLGLANLFRGLPGMKAVRLPACFLLFAVPLPGPVLNAIVFQAQIWTAEYSGWLLWVLGIPAFVSGDQVFRTHDNFAIIESCSGLRSMATMTMLSVLMVDLFRRGGPHGVILILAAPIVAFALNGVRSLTLILNPHSDVAAVHNLQGVLILLSGVLVLFGLDALLARWLPRGAATPPVEPEGVAGSAPRRPAGLVATVALAAAAILSAAVSPFEIAPRESAAPIAEVVRQQLGGFSSSELEVDRLFLGSARFREALHRRYARGGNEIDVFVAVGDHSYRHMSPFSPKTRFPGSGWQIERSGSETLPGWNREVEWDVIRRGPRRLLVYHWYQGYQGFPAEAWRSLLALDASPFRRDADGIVVRVSRELDGADEAARAASARVVANFSRYLQGTIHQIAAAPGSAGHGS